MKFTNFDHNGFIEIDIDKQLEDNFVKLKMANSVEVLHPLAKLVFDLEVLLNYIIFRVMNNKTNEMFFVSNQIANILAYIGFSQFDELKPQLDRIEKGNIENKNEDIYGEYIGDSIQRLLGIVQSFEVIDIKDSENTGLTDGKMNDKLKNKWDTLLKDIIDDNQE
jgi:hypothetical protein|tara:strand:- start:632 stop:1126 length:495 start_codon:yes stop_codon:yes gene_type:complete